MNSMEEEKREIVWYAGLPQTRLRPLATDELAALSSTATLLRLRGLLLAGSVPFSLIILTAAGILIDLIVASAPHYRSAGAILLTTLVALEIGGVLPIATAAAFRTLRRFRLVQLDLAGGAVSVCVGKAREFAVTGSQAKRIARRVRGLGLDDAVEIEVLPTSATLWRVTGERIPGLPQVARGATSSTPEFASIAAKWTKPLETLRGLVQYNRRALSDGEKEELRLYLPKMARRYVWLAALHILLIYQLSRFLGGDNFYAALALLSGVIAFLADRRMLRIMSFHRRLRHDLEEGWVLIVKTSEEESVPAVEYLPATGAEWTHAGAPSLWRKMYGRFSG